VALCAQRIELIHIFVFDGKTAIIMLKLFGTTTQNFAARVTRCPEFVHPCTVHVHLTLKMDFDVHDSVTGPN
jgi:hypothetical protein